MSPFDANLRGSSQIGWQWGATARSRFNRQMITAHARALTAAG
jgi:hypothetical protein